MKYKGDLILRSFSGEVRYKAEERKYLPFSIRCPWHGKQNRFKVTDAAMYKPLLGIYAPEQTVLLAAAPVLRPGSMSNEFWNKDSIRS